MNIELFLCRLFTGNLFPVFLMDVYTMYTEIIALNVKTNLNNKTQMYDSLNSHKTHSSKFQRRMFDVSLIYCQLWTCEDLKQIISCSH